MAEEKIISKEDLLTLKDAKTKSAFLALKAEKAFFGSSISWFRKEEFCIEYIC